MNKDHHRSVINATAMGTAPVGVESIKWRINLVEVCSREFTNRERFKFTND